jgi:hypothetical protein
MDSNLETGEPLMKENETHRSHWDEGDERLLKELAATGEYALSELADELGRSLGGITWKLNLFGIKLKPKPNKTYAAYDERTATPQDHDMKHGNGKPVNYA